MVIECPTCGRWADRTEVFQAYGFRLRVPCACGAEVPTGLSVEDLPGFEIDVEATTKQHIETMEVPGRVTEVHSGVVIDEHTPLWTLL